MICISEEAWAVMAGHAREHFPNECCGAMIGNVANDTEGGVRKRVVEAVPMVNAYEGTQTDRYEIRPEDLLKVDRSARDRGLSLIGIYHSHPDCDAYFSKTDLENSCPWYSFVVISVKGGEVDHANSFLPNAEQTHAEPEPLETPEVKRV